MTRDVKWPHPGEILMAEWLAPMGLSQYALAKAIDVPPRRINEIVKGLRGISADTALRLAAFFGTDAQSWINLQTQYDIELAKDTMADVLSKIQVHVAADGGGAVSSPRKLPAPAKTRKFAATRGRVTVTARKAAA